MKLLNITFLFIVFSTQVLIASIIMPLDQIDIHKKYLEIEVQSLGKPYLLKTFSTEQEKKGTGTSKVAKVVYFEYSSLENKLALYETSTGRVTTDSVETKRLITYFPVIKKNRRVIRFDFQAGFDYLYTLSSYQTADHKSSAGSDLKYQKSLLVDLKRENEQIQITQLVHFGRTKMSSYKLQFTFTPYKPETSFKKLKSSRNRGVGFFENHNFTHKNHGNETVYAQRVNRNKTYTYYISPNTPVIFHQAIKEGVQYWNRYFDKEILKVELETSETNLNQHYNSSIQWVEHNYGSGAYATSHIDPLSGEILQSRIYLSTVFTFNIKDRLKMSHDKKVGFTTKNKKLLNIKGFDNSTRHDQHKSHFDKVFESLSNIANNQDQQTFERASQDLVRSIIAHEVGHTLGLRHNFAASTHTDYTPETQKIEYDHYIEKNQEPTKSIASSVMDYLSTNHSLMMSKYIANTENILDYDKKALDWGYSSKNIHELPQMPFCSDGIADNKMLYDCMRHDLGKDPFHYHVQKFKNKIDQMTYAFLYRFSKSKNSNDHATKGNIRNINLSLFGFSYGIKDQLNKILSYTSNLVRLTNIESQFERVTDFNKSEIKQKTHERVRSVLDNSNILEYISSLFKKDFLKNKWTKDYIRLKSEVKHFNLDNFSNDEISYIDNLFEKVINKLEVYVQTTIVEALLSSSTIHNLFKTKRLEENMQKIVSYVVNTRGDKLLTKSTKRYDIYKPIFDIDTRRNSLNLLGASFHNKVDDYGEAQKKEIETEFQKTYKDLPAEEDRSRELKTFLNNENLIFSLN